MNKFLKWILIIAASIAVLVLIAAVVLPMVIDPNNYKDEITASVLEETGRELTIDGDIKWTVFPSLGLGLSDVKLGNREGFGDEPMFDVGEAEISVKLMPLFSKKVEIGKVNLSDVSIKLQKNAAGENNWQDLSGARAEPGTSTTSSSNQASFVISGIEISNANVSLDDVDQTTELKEFDMTASNIELGKPFDLKGSFSVNLAEPEVAGDVTFSGIIQTSTDGKRYGINGLEVTFIGQQGKETERTSLDAKVSADADIDLNQDKATLTGFALSLHDLMVTGNLDVTNLSGDPFAAGSLKVAEFNPKALMKQLGMETPVTDNASALTKLKAEMSFSGSSNGVNMQDLVANFDDSNLTGFFKLDNFERPKLAFNFEIDELNLDDYSDTSSSPGAANTSAGSDVSVDDFRGLSGGGDFRIGKLILSGLTATNVSTTMSSNAKGIRFYPVDADFYGGKHEGDIKIDATGSKPMFNADLGLSGVQAEGLLEDLTGSARLTGKGDFFLKIQSDISNSDTSIQTLSGDIGMSILDGAIIGIDVSKTLSMVSSALGKQKDVSGETTSDQRTEFAELSMSGIFTNGVLESDDLMMQSPLLRAGGKGKFNLVDETVDYVLEPVLIGGTGVEGVDKLNGVAIPIRLSGNLYEPDYKVDIVAAIAASQSELINEKKDELIDQLLGGKKTSDGDAETDEKDDDADAVKSLLGGLLGSKKKDDDSDGSVP